MYAHVCTETQHTDIHRHRYTCIHIDKHTHGIHRDMGRHTHRHKETHRNVLMGTHRHAHAGTHMHAHRHVVMYSHTDTKTHRHTGIHTHTQTQIYRNVYAILWISSPPVLKNTQVLNTQAQENGSFRRKINYS